MEGIIFGQYVRGVVSGYPTELRNGGGSVVVSAAGAITANVASGQAFSVQQDTASRITVTAASDIQLNAATGKAVYVQVGGANIAWFSASGISTGGIVTATGTSTNAFSGPVSVSGANAVTGTGAIRAVATDANAMAAFSAWRSADRRLSVLLDAGTNDTVIYAVTGAGAGTPTESFRILNASGYGQVAARWGIAVTPSYPLHVNGGSYLAGYVGINAPPTGTSRLYVVNGSGATGPSIHASIGDTGQSAGLFQQTAASATAPVAVIRLGVTPSTGGHGFVVRDSSDVNLVVLTTQGGAAGQTEMHMVSYGNSTLHRIYASGGTSASPTALISGFTLGGFAWHGRYDASNWSGATAAIVAKAAEAYTSTAQGTYLTLETTPTGSIARAEAVRIGADKTVTFHGPTKAINQEYAVRNAGDTATLAALTASGLYVASTLTQATVGAAGAASALPAQPTGYMKIKVSGTEYVVPYYAAA